MALLSFFSMSALKAADLLAATQGRENTLEPRRVEAGPGAGKWVIPSKVEDDPAFADLAPVFAVLDRVGLDTDVAWPPEEE